MPRCSPRTSRSAPPATSRAPGRRGPSSPAKGTWTARRSGDDPGLVLAAHAAALQALVSTGDIVGWRQFVIQAFQSRSCETGYLPASLWGELASESNERQDIIRTMYVRWGLALSQSFERVHSNEPVLRLPDVSMFGLAASTVLHGGFGLSAIDGDVRPLEEALEIMLQV